MMFEVERRKKKKGAHQEGRKTGRQEGKNGKGRCSGGGQKGNYRPGAARSLGETRRRKPDRTLGPAGTGTLKKKHRAASGTQLRS